MLGAAAAGQFCWVDLAASVAVAAKIFYGELFGWNARSQAAQGGSFTRWSLQGEDVGSLYQLSREHLGRGVPSHWTPYIRVANIDATAARVASLGGKVIVQPFAVGDLARIGLIYDSVGALVGLWERMSVGGR